MINLLVTATAIGLGYMVVKEHDAAPPKETPGANGQDGKDGLAKPEGDPTLGSAVSMPPPGRAVAAIDAINPDQMRVVSNDGAGPVISDPSGGNSSGSIGAGNPVVSEGGATPPLASDTQPVRMMRLDPSNIVDAMAGGSSLGMTKTQIAKSFHEFAPQVGAWW